MGFSSSPLDPSHFLGEGEPVALRQNWAQTAVARADRVGGWGAIMADEKPGTWRVVLAAILDFLLVFLVGGYVIGLLTGDTTEGGFDLNGLPALALFALVVLYFWGMNRMGGTVFMRVFRLV